MEAEWKAKRDAEAKADEARKKEQEAKERQQQEEEMERAKRLDELANMTPEQRMAEMKKTCMPKMCDAPEARKIVSSTKDAKEQAALEAVFKKNLRTTQIDSREIYAAGLDKALLQRRMNPDTVEARGMDKTTLFIKGWFCTRQTVSDLVDSNVGKDAKMLGFTKLQCEGIETWTSEL